MKHITQKEYNEISECKCGGPVLKFMNSSNNSCVVKCGYITQEYDIKSKKMVESKKKPCKYYVNSIPLNVEKVSNVEKTGNKENNENNTNLVEQLRILFEYLLISKKRNTLMEINQIVKNKLLRRANYNYFNNPYLESYEDYYSRIFSRNIIERTPVIIIKKTPQIKYLSNILYEIIQNSKNIQNDNNDQNTKLIKNNKKEYKLINQEYYGNYGNNIIYNSDSDEDSESETIPNSDEDSDSEKQSELKNDFIEDLADDIDNLDIDDPEDSDHYSD